MIIQCYAIGTPWAYFYVGDEYPLAIHRTKEAVRTAYAAGLLGDNILGSGFSCHVDVQMGGGAYISGEGTALMFGIEGKRAMPRAKVQRSVEAGLFGPAHLREQRRDDDQRALYPQERRRNGIPRWAPRRARAPSCSP